MTEGVGAVAAQSRGSLAHLRARRRARPWADAFHQGILRLLAFAVLAMVVLIGWETFSGALPALRTYGLRFLVGTDWDPVAEHFGALPYLYGTLLSSGLSLVLALPLGLGTAVYLAELAPPRLGDAVAFIVELLASIPSIVYGLWGLFALAPFLRAHVEPWLIARFGFLPLFQGAPFGIGMLNAAIVLAMMILPTIVSLSREILLSMPRALRESALALGATRAEAIAVTLDVARPGILGAVILALGRALGETMAVTMVIGNTNRMSVSLLAPGATMASVIANEFSEATSKLHLSALVEIAFVLLLVTMLVNSCARVLVIWSTGGRRDVAGAA